MNESPRRVLIRLVKQHGRKVATDGRLCRSLLNDALRNEHRKETNVLVHAVEANVVSDLVTLTTTIPVSLLIGRLVQKLRDEKGTGETEAKWAIESWLLAFELITDQQLAAVSPQLNPAGSDRAAPAVLQETPLQSTSKPHTQRIIACPSCQIQLKLPGEFIGNHVKCPGCSATFKAGVRRQRLAPREEVAKRPRKNVAPRREDNDEDDEDDERRIMRSRGGPLAPHRGTLILMFGVGSLVGGLVGLPTAPLGPIAWWLANNDLKEMDAGRMDPSGRSSTEIGKICGVICTVLIIAGLVLCFLFLALVCGCAGLGAGGHGK